MNLTDPNDYLFTPAIPSLAIAGSSQRYPVRRIEAPPLGRRVLGEDDLAVLAALSESAGRPEPEEDPEPA